MMSFWLRSLGSMESTTVVLGEHCRVSTVAGKLLESLVASPGPMARDQGRQQWWLEPVVFLYLAAEGQL